MKKAAALIFLACTACAGTPATGNPIGFTETQDYTFDIPAGSIKEAMQRFADVTSAQIVYGSDDALGVRTNPVKGQLTPDAALRQMLAGTGLTYEIGPFGHVVIKSRVTGAISRLSRH